MPKFLVENLTGRTVKLGIEPWAEVEVLAPHAKAVFDYDEPAEIAFSLDDDGGATVSIDSARIKVLTNGGEKIIIPAEGNW